jgi:CelD/BcsL family acetyltransferase involved in cellulose biosynthesis
VTPLTLASAPAAIAAAALRVEIVRTCDALRALEPEWTALAERSGVDHPFLTHEWISTWWECFGAGRELYVLVVRDDHDGALAAIVPLMRSASRVGGMRIRRLEAMTNAHSPRFDFLIGTATERLFRTIWQHLARDASWDVLRLSELPAGSHPMLELPEYARASGCLTGCWASADSPYLPIEGPWSVYVASLTARHRANLRNRTKRLGAIGPIAFENLRVSESLDAGLALEAAAWKGAAGTAIASSPEVRRFYRMLAERAAARGWLRLQFLTVGGRRVAFQYVMQYRTKQYLLKPGYDPEFAAYAPSSLLCARSLEQAFADGLEEHDFLGEAEDWKLRWTPRTRPHEWLFVFPDTMRGRLLYRLKFHVRPRLQRMALYRYMRPLVVLAGFHI